MPSTQFGSLRCDVTYGLDDNGLDDPQLAGDPWARSEPLARFLDPCSAESDADTVDAYGFGEVPAENTDADIFGATPQLFYIFEEGDTVINILNHFPCDLLRVTQSFLDLSAALQGLESATFRYGHLSFCSLPSQPCLALLSVSRVTMTCPVRSGFHITGSAFMPDGDQI